MLYPRGSFLGVAQLLGELLSTAPRRRELSGFIRFKRKWARCVIAVVRKTRRLPRVKRLLKSCVRTRCVACVAAVQHTQ